LSGLLSGLKRLNKSAEEDLTILVTVAGTVSRS
jgi:hypothetical protein